jgi:hypothetical protein
MGEAGLWQKPLAGGHSSACSIGHPKLELHVLVDLINLNGRSIQVCHHASWVVGNESPTQTQTQSDTFPLA